jgi:hypothetical protein
MLDLWLAGALERAPFPDRIDADLFEGIRFGPGTLAFWEEFPSRLGARGRADLAAAVERRVTRARRAEERSDGRGWRGALRRFDRQVLGGRLLALRRLTRPAAVP